MTNNHFYTAVKNLWQFLERYLCPPGVSADVSRPRFPVHRPRGICRNGVATVRPVVPRDEGPSSALDRDAGRCLGLQRLAGRESRSRDISRNTWRTQVSFEKLSKVFDSCVKVIVCHFVFMCKLKIYCLSCCNMSYVLLILGTCWTTFVFMSSENRIKFFVPRHPCLWVYQS
jgi:hypothetical protein